MVLVYKPFNNMKQKGFTLIEILVVIGILGFLAIAGYAAFTSSMKRSRDGRRKQDLYAVKQSLGVYYNDFQQYPTSDAQGRINQGCTPNPCGWGSSMFGPANGPYMKVLPKDPLSPSTTHVYTYNRISSDDFNLGVCLETYDDNDQKAVNDPSCPHPASVTNGKRYQLSSD